MEDRAKRPKWKRRVRATKCISWGRLDDSSYLIETGASEWKRSCRVFHSTTSDKCAKIALKEQKCQQTKSCWKEAWRRSEQIEVMTSSGMTWPPETPQISRFVTS
eukprot:scaffold523_cov101-Cylindrotheca_fusiformis.AAC.8